MSTRVVATAVATLLIVTVFIVALTQAATVL